MNDLMRTCKNINLINCSEYLIPLLIGCVFFGYVFNYDILDPANISWLTDDRFQSYIGWEFFRHTPWSFPIIGRTDYGIELSSSVVFTDSNPWLSIFFKIFSPLLPDTFQFSGIWLLICVICQSIILWKIVSLYSPDRNIKIIATLLMLFNPAWMARSGHLTLMAFFTFTVAIYLSLRYSKEKELDNNKWLLLLVFSIGIHFYLYFMVFVNWAIVYLYALFTKDKSKKEIVQYFFINSIISLVIFYTLGYLTVGSGSSVGGYGYFKANLLFPIISGSYSRLIGLEVFHPGESEGFNYLGLGFVVLILVMVFFGKVNIFKKIRNHKPLFTISLVFFFLALSNIIAVGSKEFVIPLPDFILNICGNFRASGRFIWPVTILIYIYFISITLKLDGKWPKILLSVCLLIQIVDTSFAWHANHQSMFKKNQGRLFVNTYQVLWSNYLKKYSNIRWVPTDNSSKRWAEISYFANKYKQNTDAVYYARIDTSKVASLRESIFTELVSGEYKNDTAYIMDKNYSENLKLKPGDRIFKFKDLYVLMPGVMNCSDCTVDTVKNSSFIKDKKIDVTSHGTGNILLSKGWSSPEVWGAWSEGYESNILVPDTVKNMQLSVEPFLVRGKHETIKVNFYCGITELAKVSIGFDSSKIINITLDNCVKNNNGLFIIKAYIENPVQPRELIAGSNDFRFIGFGLKEIRVTY
ncbi:DUF6311 domain-containing protein [Citrobacter youngae]|nr:DUF6311 domain-containing protein [Citrobacter youngae]MBA4711671.1 hypothetical protein [Citrobacter pasteurii]MBD0800194.1 hypothetical protein [Citrobacter sp. C6_1]NTX83816.1 hypothetical protein [Citrobacter youngae]